MFGLSGTFLNGELEKYERLEQLKKVRLQFRALGICSYVVVELTTLGVMSRCPRKSTC